MDDDFDAKDSESQPEQTEKLRKPRIKSVSRINSGPWARLQSAKCFTEIDRRLRLGGTSESLAQAIHDEFDELRDISPKALIRVLDRYRLKIPPAELSLMSSNSAISRRATRALSEGIDELEELEKLYKMQMERINIDVATEKKIGKLFDKTGSEIFIAMKIVKQSADLKMDLGLTKRQLGSVEVTGQMAAEVGGRYGENGVGKTLADPESKKKVLNIAERFMALVEKTGVDAMRVIDAEFADKSEKTEDKQETEQSETEDSDD